MTRNECIALIGPDAGRQVQLDVSGPGISARDLLSMARSPNTLAAYRTAWRGFEDWCRASGRDPLPIDQEAVAQVIAEYITALVNRRKALSTINIALSAIAAVRRAKGLAFDRSALRDLLKGARALSAAQGRTPRQARALVTETLRHVIEAQPGTAKGLRNRLLFALGFAGAMRRSELVGLDWMARGDGAGFIEATDKGFLIVLERSKGRTGVRQEITIPLADMPTAVASIEAWVRQAHIEPGTPLLRQVTKSGRIGEGRLTTRNVARIIQTEIERFEIGRGTAPAQAREIANGFSGHSLRSGYCTSAAAKGVPIWEIRMRSRHSSVEMLARYVREAEAWTNSGLKDVGF